MIFGILLAEGGGWQYALCACMLSGALLVPLLREGSFRELVVRGAMLLFAGGLGAFSFLAQDWQWQRNGQALFTGQEQTIRGTVVHKEVKNDRWQLTLALQDEKSQVILSTGECVYPLGSTLLVTGMVEDFDFPRNEGQFNEKIYYRSRQVIGRMRTEELACIRAPDGIFLWREKLYCLRGAVARVCGDMLPAGEAGILAAMLTGEKSLLDGEIRELFGHTGIGHILAISGMHVSMIGMGLYALLRRLGLGYSACGAFTAFVLFSYGTMAGMGVSTQRALFMFFVFLLAQCVGRGYDARAALGAAAAVLLCDRPFLLHSVSFRFSFAAAYAVVAIGDLLGREGQEGQERPLSRLLRPVCAALLLQLCLLPLNAYYNYELPLCAMFLNLLLLPYAGVMMGFGLAGCAAALAGEGIARLAGCGGILMNGAVLPAEVGGAWAAHIPHILFVPCRMVLTVYIRVCRSAQALPFSSVICAKPSEGKLWVYYGLLALLLFALGVRRRRLAADGASGREGARVLLCSLLWGVLLTLFLCRAPERGFELSFLDVGQGDGAFLRTEEGVTCFVDGGSTDVSGVGTYRLLPFLKSKGVRRIDYWLLSHLDEDHVSGFYEVLASGYEIGCVVLAKGCVRDEAWERLTAALKRQGVPFLLVGAGDAMQLYHSKGAPVPFSYDDEKGGYVLKGGECFGEEGAHMRFLAPGELESGQEDRNAASLVCLFEEQGFRALFTGDIGTGQEERLLSETALFQRVPDPGGRVSESGKSAAESPGGQATEPGKSAAESPGGQALKPDESAGTGFGGRVFGIDVSKAAHHGSDYSNSAEFLQALSPRICVVSCARRNRYGHPGEEALLHMREAGSRVLCTMDCGQVKVRRRGKKFFVTAAQNF